MQSRDPHPFDPLDTAAVARALSQLAPAGGGPDRGGDDGGDDWADAFFERREEVELPADGEAPGLRVRREEGLAVRLVRGGAAGAARTWLSARDSLEPEAFSDALRQVARVMPSAFYPEPRLDAAPWESWDDLSGDLDRMAELPLAVGRAIRTRHVAFPVRLTVRRHRRWIQVVGPRLVPEPESERFYSLRAELPWGRWGTLLPELSSCEAVAEGVAEALVERFRGRNAPPPAGAARGVVVLAPQAAAVFLHEAVAHALEADTLGLGGRPEAAVGVRLGDEDGTGTGLSVLDDPGTAPEPVRRRSDDEGVAVTRRWLLRDGVVAQPLADRAWARGSEALLPGAGRRAGRHEPPGPRSTHLEILTEGGGEPVAPGGIEEPSAFLDGLLDGADGGLLVSQVSRGALDPLSGRFVLEVPCARRLRHATPAEPVGPFRVVGSVAGLISRIAAVGTRARVAGAGWCAKDGRLLPVWATTPGLRLEGVEVAP